LIFWEILRAILALGFTLAITVLIAYGLRRFGPDTLTRLQGLKGPAKRMVVLETLMLDPQRRLILFRLDREEKLLLLGEGQILQSQPVQDQSSQPVEPPSQ
jgi:flagellar protein FliO/FliZ